MGGELKSDLRGIETDKAAAMPMTKTTLKSDLRGIETQKLYL